MLKKITFSHIKKKNLSGFNIVYVDASLKITALSATPFTEACEFSGGKKSSQGQRELNFIS